MPIKLHDLSSIEKNSLARALKQLPHAEKLYCPFCSSSACITTDEAYPGDLGFRFIDGILVSEATFGLPVIGPEEIIRLVCVPCDSRWYSDHTGKPVKD